MTRWNLSDPSHREERVAKTLGHRRWVGHWATRSNLGSTMAVLPGTKLVHLWGTEQPQPQARQGEVLPKMQGQGEREAWSLTPPCMPHLGSNALFEVLSSLYLQAS